MTWATNMVGRTSTATCFARLGIRFCSRRLSDAAINSPVSFSASLSLPSLVIFILSEFHCISIDICFFINNFFQTRITFINCDFRIRSHVAHQRVLRRLALFAHGWQSVDTANAPISLLHPQLRVRNGLLHQLHRHLLPRVESDSVRHDAGGDLHLHLRHSAADARRNHRRSESQRSTRPSVPSQRRSTTHTREEVVHGAGCDYDAWRNFAVRINLH